MATKKTGKVTKTAATTSAGKKPARSAAKQSAKKGAANKPAKKPAAKPALAKPAAKPAISKPAISKPALAKPAAKPALAKAAAKPALAKAAAKPAVAKAAAKPAPAKATPAKAAAKPAVAKAAAKPAVAKAAPAKQPAKVASAPAGLSASAIESTFGVKLQPRYRNFIETGEYARYNDRLVSDVPGLGFSPQVVFDAPKLLTIFRTNGVKIESKIPLAAFRGNPELLTVDVGHPACPVGVWDSGSFFELHPSLDALLASLKESPKPPLHESAMDDDLADDGD